MEHRNLFVLADAALRRTVDGLTEEQWRTVAPAWLRAREEERTIRDVVASHASEPSAEMWRRIGVIGPPVEVPPDADKQTRLLGLTGYLVRR